MKPAAYFRRARALVCESAARHGRSSAELQRSQISALLMQLGMLPQQLLAGAGTGRLARRALHDPLGRLEKNRAYGDAGPGDDPGAHFALNRRRVLQQLLALDFGDQHDLFRPKIRIVQAHGNGATVVDGRMCGSNLLDVLRIDVLATDNQQVFLASHDVQLAVNIETEIAAVIPAVDERLRGEVGTVVIAFEEAIAADENLADIPLGENLTAVGRDAYFMPWQKLTRRDERERIVSALRNGDDAVRAAELPSIGPDARRFCAPVNARLGDREDVLRHCVGRLHCRSLQPDGSKSLIELVNTGGADRFGAVDQRPHR